MILSCSEEVVSETASTQDCTEANVSASMTFAELLKAWSKKD
jgi:hypothetical protein